VSCWPTAHRILKKKKKSSPSPTTQSQEPSHLTCGRSWWHISQFPEVNVPLLCFQDWHLESTDLTKSLRSWNVQYCTPSSLYQHFHLEKYFCFTFTSLCINKLDFLSLFCDHPWTLSLTRPELSGLWIWTGSKSSDIFWKPSQETQGHLYSGAGDVFFLNFCKLFSYVFF
jgi:hypothetical protein